MFEYNLMYIYGYQSSGIIWKQIDVILWDLQTPEVKLTKWFLPYIIIL